MAQDENASFSADLSADVSVLLNLDLSGVIAASTPKRSRRGRAAANAKQQSPFKKPNKAPRKLGPVLATCDLCGAQYRTLKYYLLHRDGHKLKELASRVPNVEGILERSGELGMKVLNVMGDKPDVYGKMGTEFKELLSSLKTEQDSDEWKEILQFLLPKFSVVLSSDKIRMPSALLTTALRIADDILSRYEDRKYVSERIKILHKCSDSVINSFFCEFVLTLSDNIFILVCRSLRNADENSTQEKEVNIDQGQRQVIFHIGGSVVHTLRMFGVRYSSNKKWKKIVEVIDSKILEDDFWESLSSQQKVDRLWTDKVNRGGLKFVKEKMQVFLVSVARMIITNRKTDGSLPVEPFLEKLVQSDARLEWDLVVGTSLDQDTSLSLMTSVAKKMMTSYGNGIVMRYLNALNDKSASVAMPLLHKLAVTGKDN